MARPHNHGQALVDKISVPIGGFRRRRSAAAMGDPSLCNSSRRARCSCRQSVMADSSSGGPETSNVLPVDDVVVSATDDIDVTHVHATVVVPPPPDDEDESESPAALPPGRSDLPPTDSGPPPPPPPASKFAFLERASGLLYLAVSVGCAIYYLKIVGPTLKNDLFWANFDQASAQTYLLDAFSNELLYSGNEAVDLFDPGYASLKQYGAASTSLELKATYPRKILMASMPVEDAIVGLQSLSIAWSPRSFTQYCWLNMARTWELAHTAARATRCKQNQTANGAMYLELQLRSFNWQAYTKQWGTWWQSSIGVFLDTQPDGAAWLSGMTNAYKDVPTEVAFWTSHGIDHYWLQWNNYIQQGIDETIVVKNALGWTQKLTTTHIPMAKRGALWTTALAYWSFYDDYWSSSLAGDPIVRQSPNFMIHMSFEDVLGVYPNTPASKIIHNLLGPFISVDMFLMPPPASLIAFAAAFDKAIMSQLLAADDFRTRFTGLSDVTLDPVSLQWRAPTLVHFGGSVMCAFGSGSSFVQPQISFVDSCGAQVPTSQLVQPKPLLFGLVGVQYVAANLASICSVCATTGAVCNAAIPAAAAALAAWQAHAPAATQTQLTSMSRAALADVVAMNVEYIQYSNDMTTPSTPVGKILTQPLLASPAATTPFNLYGWVDLYEWVTGYREVVQFVGDVSWHTIMSERLVGAPFKASAIEVPNYTCSYIWYITVFTTLGIVGVAVITFVYICIERFQIQGRHLFMFNRVMGPVWVGRPLMLIRAVSAIILLSSAQVSFDTVNNLSHFTFKPRHWIESIIVTGEATWLTYVVNDFLLIATGTQSKWYAPMSSILVWCITLGYEIQSPVQMTAAINRQCTRTDMDTQVTCSAGTVEIGTTSRLITILIVNAACIAGSFVVIWVGHKIKERRGLKHDIPFLIAASGAAFLDVTEYTWSISSAASAMCGLLPFKIGNVGYVLDTKLWLVFNTSDDTSFRTETRSVFHRNTIVGNAMGQSTGKMLPSNNARSASRTESRIVKATDKAITYQRLKTLVGVGYLGATLFGSVTYLIVAKDRLANDFWWEKFNSTGAHAFLGNWFNGRLMMTGSASKMLLNDPKYSAMTLYPDAAGGIVSFSAPYIRKTVYEDAAEISTAIQGLRQTDPCQLPWLATAYCWVDFGKKYGELANSAARQARCLTADADNGAVYLEAVLRNINSWPVFQSCWGTSFDIGIATTLNAGTESSNWLAQTTKANAKSVADEATYWKAAGLQRFTTQWQNFKSHGMFDSFTVTNAFGLSYPLTLKASNGTFRIATQTTMKMYWGWASDLWAVATPGTLVTGKSLIRSTTPSYAFNGAVTMESVLFQNTSMTSPLSPGYQLFHNLVGPFGSVDLRHVAVPAAVTAWYQATVEAYAAVVAGSLDAQKELNAMTQITAFMPQPAEWDAPTYTGFGGNILCNELPNPQPFTAGMMVFFGVDITCNTGVSEWLYTTTPHVIYGLIASGIANDAAMAARVLTTCNIDTNDAAKCKTNLPLLSRWVAKYVSSATLASLQSAAATALTAINGLNIQYMQYAQLNAPPANYVMLRRPMFKSPAVDSFDYFSWLYVTDWNAGFREVVKMEGDNGAISLISAYSGMTNFPVNVAEVPTNVSTYFRAFCEYITGVLICVAFLVVSYSIVNGFKGEALNFFELNRVAGIVWVGRPLLFLRSMTALCLLSTASLELTAAGFTSSFTSVTTPWYTTILASGEMCWLVYIVNDFLMVYTLHLTDKYTTVCGLASWAITAILSFAAPVTHSVTISRACDAAILDMQLVCNSGSLAIGSPARFWTLVGIAIGMSLVCITVVRLVVGKPTETPEKTSLMISCGAKYLFVKNIWVHNNVYYIDFASAIMTGLLVVHAKGTFYVLDIKAWRTLVVPSASYYDSLDGHPNAASLRCCFPLIK
ncbi:Aste57867_15385 [Aphanomyces stellatus]|uniref:Aste57867_15385 protein n=1 Tax=Aphanomyces stellatus TaxID=120398 RepID=A0A485L4W0_9STRA|nr:hypothetical protein As57867_015329 [Aphanomyces stellatus]VFT92191.1 Aste57867_15385 [Aphanomyces stellatus]